MLAACCDVVSALVLEYVRGANHAMPGAVVGMPLMPPFPADLAELPDLWQHETPMSPELHVWDRCQIDFGAISGRVDMVKKPQKLLNRSDSKTGDQVTLVFSPAVLKWQ